MQLLLYLHLFGAPQHTPVVKVPERIIRASFSALNHLTACRGCKPIDSKSELAMFFILGDLCLQGNRLASRG